MACIFFSNKVRVQRVISPQVQMSNLSRRSKRVGIYLMVLAIYRLTKAHFHLTHEQPG